MTDLVDLELLKDMIREDTENDTINTIEDSRSMGIDYLFNKDEFLD